MLKVTVDVSADLRRLKRLESTGKIELFAVAIENHKNTRKIKNKQLPTALIGSKFATIGNSVIASETNKFHHLQSIVGKEHHADILHLERHLESDRDYFVTDDNDFLSKREMLFDQLGVQIVTVEELEDLVKE